MAEAIRLNEEGAHISAEQRANFARTAFQHSGNRAGEIRAQLEMAYSFDRRDEPDECLATLHSLRPDASRHGYLWIAAQARLEKVTCLTQTRKADIISAKQLVFREVEQTRYEGLTLRALGFLAEDYVSADTRLHLWQRGQEGLSRFWRNPLPPLRGYAFYYSLAYDAKKAGDLETAIALLQESILLLKGSGITGIRALLLANLGDWQTSAGHTHAANTSFAESKSAFAKLPLSEAQGFRREAAIAEAQALVSSGRPARALVRLKSLTTGMVWPYKDLDDNVRRSLLPTLGNAYLANGDTQQACLNYFQTVSELQNQLRQVHNQGQRDNALHQAEAAFRGLTDVEIRLGRPADALAIWERFRSGRFESYGMDREPLPGCSPRVSVGDPIVNAKGITVLVYASLPSGLSAWMRNSSGLEQIWIDPEKARLLADRFARLASNRDSPLKIVTNVSQKLYALLLGPFSKQMNARGTLLIDCEGSLADIPWSALEDPHNHPVVESFAVVQSIGIPKMPTQGYNFSADLTKTVIFGSPSLQGELRTEYPPIASAALEAEQLHRRIPGSLLFIGPKATASNLKRVLPAATFFHFAGHGVSFGGFGALLLPASERAPGTQYLTGQEISQLQLRELQTAVLSACSSGVGEQSGIVNLDSLTGALFQAGVHQVVASDWEIDDASTTKLMTFFYDHLLKGQSVEKSLQDAEASVRRQSPHPYYWAGFQIFWAQ